MVFQASSPVSQSRVSSHLKSHHHVILQTKYFCDPIILQIHFLKQLSASKKAPSVKVGEKKFCILSLFAVFVSGRRKLCEVLGGVATEGESDFQKVPALLEHQDQHHCDTNNRHFASFMNGWNKAPHL